MFELPKEEGGAEVEAEGEPDMKEKEKEKGPYADFVDDDEDRDERDDDDDLDTTGDGKEDSEEKQDKELSQDVVDKYFEDQEAESKDSAATLSLPETDMKLRAETELANPNSPKNAEEEE